MGATLADLTALVLDLWDMTGTGRATSARVTDYINIQARAVHSMLVRSGEDHLFDSASISLVAGTESYALDAVIGSVEKVWVIEGGKRYELGQFQLRDLDYDRLEESRIVRRNRDLAYRVMGRNIWMRPEPLTAGSLEVMYQPRYVPLEDAADELPDYFPDQAQDFIVFGAAACATAKDESTYEYWLSERERCRQTIEEEAANLDHGEPHRMVRVRR